MSKTRSFFTIYQRILRSVFILWFFLWLAGKFGFSFALKASHFFRIFLFLFFVLLVSETKKRWPQIYPVMKKVIRKNDIRIIIRKCLILFFSKNGVFWLTVLGLIIDIFVFNFVSILLVLFFIVLLLLTIRLHQFGGKVIVVVGLILLTLCPFLLAFKTKPITIEKVAIWTYVFLAIGAGQMFIKDIRDTGN